MDGLPHKLPISAYLAAMSAVFMFLSLGQRAGGKLKQTAYFLLDTERLLFDFAKAIDQRRAQTDEVVFEWRNDGWYRLGCADDGAEQRGQ